MDLTRDYFEFLGIKRSFELDRDDLNERFLSLQKQLHPDRHAHTSDRDRRMAEQYSAYLNQAKATLLSPVLRGFYLLQLDGFVSDKDQVKVSDTAFLMEQLEQRELLESATDAEDPYQLLEGLHQEVELQQLSLLADVSRAFLLDDKLKARELLGKMQFLEKLLKEIELVEERLDD